MFEIREDDLSHPDTQALLALHLNGMHASSPAGSVFALDLSGLREAGVTVWTVWNGGQIAGVGALKDLSSTVGELKSMRTSPDFLRQGVADALLDFIMVAAQSRGMHRLSLETGSGPAFEAAVALYRRRGFSEGAPFSDYNRSDFSRFFHLNLPTRRDG